RLRQERNIDVLGAGSLIPLKQYDVFIRIIGRLSKKYPAITAVICGKGPELVALQELVKHLGLENNVRLAGEISNPGVLRLMQQCRVFLHTSCYEGFGMVCLEALYAGAHVVSFVKPMHTGIGHWHIVNNEAEMENKMLELLSGHLTHTPVLAFSMKDTVHQIAALYPQSAHPPL
ncbi:MAG TPA: glycosyltransferase, partial [Chitinophagaceae bacterium]|nr:glycosyltransferase [Chitinophagaceae bacterium]